MTCSYSDTVTTIINREMTCSCNRQVYPPIDITDEDDETVAMIKELLDTRIRYGGGGVNIDINPQTNDNVTCIGDTLIGNAPAARLSILLGNLGDTCYHPCQRIGQLIMDYYVEMLWIGIPCSFPYHHQTRVLHAGCVGMLALPTASRAHDLRLPSQVSAGRNP